MKRAALKYFLFLSIILCEITFPSFALEEIERTEYTLIYAGFLLTSAEKPLQKEQTIIIRNNLIEDIKKGYLSPQALNLPSAKIIDLKKYFILPGLMDMHVHLTKNKGQNDSKIDDTERVIIGLVNARKTLRAGYTTVRDVGSHGKAIFTVKKSINKGSFIGPRIFASGHILYVTADESYSGSCFNIASCKKAVRKQIDLGADLIKIYITCSGSKSCGRETAPPLLLQQELKAIIETAKTREITNCSSRP